MSTLYYGDNLRALRKKIPSESIDLCYIDPPFNSKRNYNQIYNRIGDDDDGAQAQAFIDTWRWDDLAIASVAEILENPDGRFQPRTIELVEGLEKVLGRGSLFAYVMKLGIYTDTSVIGGCHDDEFRMASKRLFAAFKAGRATLVVSDLTRLELEGAPLDVQLVLDDVPMEHRETWTRGFASERLS